MRTAEIFLKHNHGLMNFFLSHGVPWREFSFRGRLAKRVVFPAFVSNIVRYGRLFRRPNAYRVPGSESFFDSRSFNGKLDKIQSLMNSNRIFCDLAGVNRVNVNAKKYIKEALTRIREGRPDVMPEPLFDRGFLKFRIGNIMTDNRNSIDYFYGSPLTRDRFLSSLRNSFEVPPRKSTFIHRDTYLGLSVFQRYGICDMR